MRFQEKMALERGSTESFSHSSPVAEPSTTILVTFGAPAKGVSWTNVWESPCSSRTEGNAATCAASYGRSPITARSSGFAEPVLIGVPLPAPAPHAVTSATTSAARAMVVERFTLVPSLIEWRPDRTPVVVEGGSTPRGEVDSIR